MRDADGALAAGRRGARRGRARRRSSWPRRRASPSSTAPTACSACWCWRSPTCAMLLRDGRHRRRDERRGPARHRPGLRRRPAGAAPAPGPGRVGGQPARAARRTPAIVASHRGPDCNRVQDAYSLRCSPQVHGAARDTVEHAATVAGRELAVGRRQPGRARPTGGSSPTATSTARRSRYVLDFLAIVAADVASHQRAAHRPVPRRGPQPRPAAVPRRRPRRRQRAHDRAVHPGRDRLRAQAARGPGLRRLDPVVSAMQEDHVSMGWSAARKLRRAVDGLTRVLAIEVLTAARGARPARAAASRRRRTGAVVAALRDARSPGPGPDRYLAPEIEAAVELVAAGAVRRRRRGRRPDRSPDPRQTDARPRGDHVMTAPAPSAPRAAPTLTAAVVADRGAAADADEQPRPRGRRAPRGPRRLRRHRQGGARLARRTTRSSAR